MPFAGSRGWSNRDRLIASLLPFAICFGCALLMVSTASTLTLQAGFLDPYVYAGYVHDYVGTFARYGQTYYSSRIAYIFLDRAFISLFGETAGLFLCRLVVFTAAAYAAFQIAKRYFGWGPALLAVSWLCFIPWLLRSITWTHYDGFATVYLIVAFAFLIAPRRHLFAAHVAAGFFFALSVNCNLHLLMVGGLFAPSWYWLNRSRPLREIALLAIATVSGFILAYAILQLLFSLTIWNFHLFIEAATLRSAKELLGGELANWSHSFSELIANGNYIFLVPIFFCCAALFTLTLNRNTTDIDAQDFSIAAFSYNVLLLTFVLILHFFFHHTWFSVFYYDIYFLPACLFVLISLAGAMFIRTSRTARVICYGACVPLVALWFTRETLDISLRNDIYLWAYFTLAILVGALLKPKITAAPALVIGLLCATYGIFQMQSGVMPQYTLWPGHDHRMEKDVYRGALFLQNIIRRRVPTDKTVGFWYSNAPENVNLNSIQSIFLWGYSRLQDYTGPGMPLVDGHFKKLIPGESFIAILARSNQKIEAAFAALRAVQARYHEISRDSYTSATENYHVVLATLSHVPPKLGNEIQSIDLKKLVAQNGSSVLMGPEGALLKTASCMWCYSVAVSVPLPARPTDVVARLDLTVHNGKIGIGTINSDDTNALHNLVSIAPANGDQIIDLKIKRSTDNTIVFRNESADGASQAVIRSIKLDADN